MRSDLTLVRKSTCPSCFSSTRLWRLIPKHAMSTRLRCHTPSFDRSIPKMLKTSPVLLPRTSPTQFAENNFLANAAFRAMRLAPTRQDRCSAVCSSAMPVRVLDEASRRDIIAYLEQETHEVRGRSDMRSVAQGTVDQHRKE